MKLFKTYRFSLILSSLLAIVIFSALVVKMEWEHFKLLNIVKNSLENKTLILSENETHELLNTSYLQIFLDSCNEYIWYLVFIFILLLGLVLGIEKCLLGKRKRADHMGKARNATDLSKKPLF